MKYLLWHNRTPDRTNHGSHLCLPQVPYNRPQEHSLSASQHPTGPGWIQSSQPPPRFPAEQPCRRQAEWPQGQGAGWSRSLASCALDLKFTHTQACGCVCVNTGPSDRARSLDGDRAVGPALSRWSCSRASPIPQDTG